MRQITRILIILSAGLLVSSLFFPIWRIELDAPQYPEGLTIQIFSNGLKGDIEIVNGLNHYIGMKTLHSDEFPEFRILPIVIGIFAVAALFVAWSGKKKQLTVLLIGFVLFGVVAMADFWKWEYDYGHNLNPGAAIKVPGMAYQPPLIGFKQLLNFGAYSIPDIGGWMFIGAGLCFLIAMFQPKKTQLLAVFLLLSFASCSEKPEIKLGKDHCAYCKMTVSDPRFGAVAITKEGRRLCYDDIRCLVNHRKTQNILQVADGFVAEFGGSHTLISIDSAFFLHSLEAKSPMGGNIATASTQTEIEALKTSLGGDIVSLQSVLK